MNATPAQTAKRPAAVKTAVRHRGDDSFHAMYDDYNTPVHASAAEALDAVRSGRIFGGGPETPGAENLYKLGHDFIAGWLDVQPGGLTADELEKIIRHVELSRERAGTLTERKTATVTLLVFRRHREDCLPENLAPRSGPKPVVPAPEPAPTPTTAVVPADVAPAEGKDGRLPNGRFSKGNKCNAGVGNPTARRMTMLRSELLADLDGPKMRALGKRLYAAALAGNLDAAKLLLQYAIGKPTKTPDADRLDLDEFKLLDESPSPGEVMRVAADGLDPAEVLGFLRGVLAARPDLRTYLLGNLDAQDEDDEEEGSVGRKRLASAVVAEAKARVGRRK